MPSCFVQNNLPPNQNLSWDVREPEAFTPCPTHLRFYHQVILMFDRFDSVSLSFLRNLSAWRHPITRIPLPCWGLAVFLLRFEKDWILRAKDPYDKRLPTFPMITFPKVNASVSTEGNISPAFFNNLLAFTAFPFMMTAPAALRIPAPLRDWNLLVTGLPDSCELHGTDRLLTSKIKERMGSKYAPHKILKANINSDDSSCR